MNIQGLLLKRSNLNEKSILNQFDCVYILFSFSMLLVSPVFSQTTPSDKNEYLHPANKEKVINETVDEFYQALRDLKQPIHQEVNQRYKLKLKQQQRYLDTVLFKEIPDASVNVRKKLLFNQVKILNYITFDGDILRTYPDIDVKYYQPRQASLYLKTLKKNLEVIMQFMMLKQK